MRVTGDCSKIVRAARNGGASEANRRFVRIDARVAVRDEAEAVRADLPEERRPFQRRHVEAGLAARAVLLLKCLNAVGAAC